ncbi:uncharacterized protein HMPREF1541_05461 [Cyphellophora europaea CBS 101466]|uniref:Amino acid permease/ SLC12A domain-containing protein n=1 Tax=Cyphellophora europaea (strain CBS 101466) TaxID=1220924 RepID=W2RTZ2_CYPE1|nr:uncharacterized protein HMPREF1541_05461 [Cyphellophora europaea CBS 101466]ETN39238.1 hypothetical protein HMPREF1541_05461 [Cyphellophora europaea CBS 101466]
MLYTFATGTFVANVSWQDQNLPQLFQQLLTPTDELEFQKFADGPNTSAAPLIALIRAEYSIIPTVVNACFIYSALSCANTALFVASRQLYGLTRTITVEEDSNVVRRILAWMSTINHKTKTPWPAIAMSALFFCWLPFIRIRDTESEYLQDVCVTAVLTLKHVR